MRERKYSFLIRISCFFSCLSNASENAMKLCTKWRINSLQKFVCKIACYASNFEFYWTIIFLTVFWILKIIFGNLLSCSPLDWDFWRENLNWNKKTLKWTVCNVFLNFKLISNVFLIKKLISYVFLNFK